MLIGRDDDEVDVGNGSCSSVMPFSCTRTRIVHGSRPATVVRSDAVKEDYASLYKTTM